MKKNINAADFCGKEQRDLNPKKQVNVDIESIKKTKLCNTSDVSTSHEKPAVADFLMLYTDISISCLRVMKSTEIEMSGSSFPPWYTFATKGYISTKPDLMIKRFKHLVIDERVYICCNLISSSLVYNSKLRIFIPRFLDSCSLTVCFVHSKTDFIPIRLLICDSFSFLLVCLLMVNFKKHLFNLNLPDFLNCLGSLKIWTFSSPNSYVCFPEMKPSCCDLYENNLEYILKDEKSSDCDRVITLREQPMENQVGCQSRQFYGDVNLQTQNYENDRMQMCPNNEQSVILNGIKSPDDGLDSLKRTVRNNTELPDEKCQRNDHFIVAPVTKPKNRKKRRSPQSDDHQDGQVDSNENGNSSYNEGQQSSSSVPTISKYNTTELDRATSVEDNAGSQIHIDGGLCMNPSNKMPIQTGNDEKNAIGVGACSNEVFEQNASGYGLDVDLLSGDISGTAGAQGYASNLVKPVSGDLTVVNVSLEQPNKKEVEGHTAKEPEDTRPSQTENGRSDLSESENGNRSSMGVPVASDSNLASSSQNVDSSDTGRFEPLMNIIDKIADGERVPPQITMQYEMLRFCTLRSFPKYNKPYISKIAAAGFYYANTEDEVVCYSCARRKSNWREDDDPMEIHRQLNPNCSYLLRNSEVNVPVRASVLSNNERPHNRTSVPLTQRTDADQINTSNDSLPNARSSVVTSSGSVNILPSSSSSPGLLNRTTETRALTQQLRAHGNFVSSNTSSPLSSDNRHQSSANNQVGQQSTTIPTVTSGSQNSNAATSGGSLPKYPKYASKPVRLVSFNDCGDIVIPPDTLATSGFFYAGFGDCVRCFHCGVGLRHWSNEDDPWIEHSRWSKDCLFVKQVKGQEFVNLVQMAVQYSQNNSSNGENGTHIPEPNADAANRDITENLMHTNAAQSVLEMGYHPDVIRRAIRAIKDANSEEILSATNLMEKIFELEDLDDNENSDTTSNSVSSEQSNRTVSSTLSSNSRDNTAVRRDSVTEPRPDRSSSQAPLHSENQMTSPSAASNVDLVAATNTSGSSHSSISRKSQLLEQKKLQEENKQLKEQSLCIKCKKNDVCIVFLPCGHLVTCETCAPTIKYCTVEGCGKYIKGTVRTYLA